MSNTQATAQKPVPQPKAKQDGRVVIRAYRIEPPVNWPVHWYPQGDRKRKPCAGTPIDCNGRGQIGLAIIDGSGQTMHKRTVPWIGDPDLRFKRDYAADQGAWDWIPGLVPAQYQNMAPEEPVILMLYKQHRQVPREIAEYLGTDWSIPLIEAVLEKHGALDRQNVVATSPTEEMRKGQE